MIRKITRIIGCLLALGSFVQATAQSELKLPNKKIRCYTVEHQNELRKKNPNIETDAQFEAWLAPLIQQHQTQSSILPVKPYKLVMVFHVINGGEAIGSGTNVSQELINANILQLNKDYANLSNSPYASATNTGLQFALATTSPTGTVLTEPGIDRIDATTKATWTASPWSTAYMNSTIKPATIWDPTKYLNIWVAPMSGGILGFATFPTSSGLTGLSGGETATNSGVALDPSTVGSVFSPGGGCGANTYNLGKTLTHELGHFFGLRHIWGDNQPNCGNDYVADTPPQSDMHNGTFSHPNPDAVCGTPDQMFENYMDYTDDHQLNTFTALQVDRIQTVMLNSPRRKTLPTAGLPSVDVTGTDSISFAECLGALTFLETGDTGGAFRYKDVSILLNVDGAATDSTFVNIDATGTAIQGIDYDILNPTINFRKGESTKAIKLRIYDNSRVEGDRQLTLTYNISGAGLQPASSAQALLITIMDDDNYFVGQKTINVLNENFGTTGGAIPKSWGTATSSGYPNSFVVGTRGTAGGTGQCAYISGSTTTKNNTYIKGVSGAAVIATPTISGQNVKALGTLNFKYKVRGLAGSDQGYLVYRVAYDTTKAFNFFGTTNGTSGYGPYSGTGATFTGTPTLTPTSDMNNERFRIYFYWMTGTNTTGINPGLNIDDIVFTATPFPIETGITSSYYYDVFPSTFNQFKSKKGNALAVLLDSTAAIPSFKIATIDSGSTKKTINYNGNSLYRASKVFQLTEANVNNSALYTLGLYFTDAELSAFGTNKNNLQLLHIADGTSITSTLDYTNSTLTSPIVIDSSANHGYLLFVGQFSGLGTYALVDTSVILPVNLVSLKATLENNKVKINWTTTKEVNNKGFDVERSLDGAHFTSIGFVEAGKENVTNNYSLTDAQVSPNNKYYYRLKQVDVNGKYAYSSIVSVVYLDTKKWFSIHPNPVTDKLIINKNIAGNQKAEIEIDDASGKTVYKSTLNMNQLSIATSNWSKGVYMVKISTNEGVTTTKIVKQ